VVVTVAPSIANVPAASVSTLADAIEASKVVTPPLFTIKLSNSSVLPTAALKVALPVPVFRVKSRAVVSLSITSAKLILPIPVSVPMTKSPFRVIPVAKLRLVFVVVKSPANLFNPAPFWVKPEVAVISPAASVVNRPALVTVLVPPLAKTSFTVNAFPVNAKLPDRLTAPLNVVVPVPAD